MGLLRNIPVVTKNLLIINLLMFLLTIVLAGQQMDVSSLLGTHYFNSPLFEPYQLITHMFMHSLNDFTHILFNMLMLVMFGSHLEREWGAQRFFIFYFASGLGAIILYNSIGFWEMYQLKQTIQASGVDLEVFNNKIKHKYFTENDIRNMTAEMVRYIELSYSSMIGASGALFGVLAGFAVLFPNLKLMLLFPPIPIKAKFLVGAYLLYEIYSSLFNQNDQVAHLAHVGGAIVGIILVLIWKRQGKKHF
jgi:membrane associated rhomboid family serine protease